MDTRPRPLAGVTIIDLADEATVLAARLLGELGARVIRVEDASGDGIRSRPPFLHGEPGPERSYAHLLYNANKLSLALRLDRAEAWAVVERIALAADAVIAPLDKSAYLRDFLARLSTIPGAPGVVDVVFRRAAPAEVATDLIATAAGGLLVLNGYPDDPPNYPAGQLAYKEASLAAAHAVLALVLERRRTGRAGAITVSLQEAVNFTTLQTSNANWWHWQGRVPTRDTPLSPLTTYRSGDGRWVSFTVHPPNWPRYAAWVEEVLGTGELLGPEWGDPVHRGKSVRILAGFTTALCARFTREQLINEGQARGLLVLPVNTLEDIAADVHLGARGFVEPVAYPALGETLRLPRTAFLSNAHGSATTPAPGLGQHTAQVLSEAGLGPREIDALFASGVAHGPRSSPGGPANHARSQAATPGPGAGHGHPARQPLEGIRILDFCWAIAGPLGTRLLADLGADVIKVESEYRLDPIRQIGVQPRGEASWNTNGQYNDCNTNKRAITLNLNTPEGVEIARALVATADVVTSNYTPDRLDRWGLGYEAMRAIKPDIIAANLAVMGTSGPHKGWRSYGSGIVAMCGLAELTGFPGRDPIGLGTLHTDFTVPYFAAVQVMAALIHRDRTGEGQSLELSQYEASVHLLDTEFAEYLNDGTVPERRGNGSRRFAPNGVFSAAGEDRWVALACRDDADWAGLCGVPGLEALTDLDRHAQADEVDAVLAVWTRQRDRWDAAAILQAAGVPASPVEDLRDLLEHDPGMAADYRELALPSGVSAIVQEQPITWDGHRLPLRRAPLWGEHTAEVLGNELGLSPEAIADLTARGVLF